MLLLLLNIEGFIFIFYMHSHAFIICSLFISPHINGRTKKVISRERLLHEKNVYCEIKYFSERSLSVCINVLLSLFSPYVEKGLNILRDKEI